MIRTLDIYLLRRFLTGLFATILSFTVIVFVVDFVERGWRIIERFDVPLDVIALYYANYLPFYIILAFPVAMLVSTLFSIGALARNHELDVMKASGISLYRIAAPVLVAAFIISVGVMFFGEFVLTKTERRKDEIKQHLIEKRPAISKMTRRDIKVPGDNGWIILSKTYDVTNATALGVRIHRIVDNKIAKTYTAERMVSSDSGWVLLNGTGQEFAEAESNGDERGSSTEFPKENFTRFDTLWAPFLSQSPKMLAELPVPPRQINFFQLMNRIDQEREIGEPVYKDLVELYLKITFPLANFILVLIGAPLAANPRRSGPSVGFGLSIIISFVFFVLIRIGQSLGNAGKLPPLLAASLGDMVFILFGAFLMLKARK
jgi:lipopolysaccharide export system permease protein